MTPAQRKNLAATLKRLKLNLDKANAMYREIARLMPKKTKRKGKAK